MRKQIIAENWGTAKRYLFSGYHGPGNNGFCLWPGAG